MLKGKTVLLGVSSSIAAYKARLPGVFAGEAARQRPRAHDPERHPLYLPHGL